MRVSAPIHAPLYSFDNDRLLGLTDDKRIASVDATGPAGSGPADTSFSPMLADVGRNFQISPYDSGIALVPQPALNRVAEVKVSDLRPVGAFAAGPTPSYVSQDSGANYLLALSADRSTVTAVDLHRNDILGSQAIATPPPESTIEGAQRGRVVEFHVLGSGGISHYKGHTMPVEKHGELPVSVEAAVGDPTKVSRAYLAEKGTDKLVAVDSKHDRESLEVVGTASVGEPIRAVAVDDTRIYAATDSKLVVLQTNAFGGYPDARIPTLRTFDYRSELPRGPAASASVSGLAAGRHHVFLTLDGVPFVVRVAKPHV
ncbi:MAG TPA: hypothetical protein VFB19_14820 [Mycobacterium sp.]|nr:hypothetical protein [Mycobacterium sp.]